MLKNRIKTALKNRRGSTIVEVMVAFVLLMICLAMFTQVIQLATNLLSDAKWITEEQEHFNEEYYKTSTENKNELNEITLTTPEGGTLALPEVKLWCYAPVSGIKQYYFKRD